MRHSRVGPGECVSYSVLGGRSRWAGGGAMGGKGWSGLKLERLAGVGVHAVFGVSAELIGAILLHYVIFENNCRFRMDITRWDLNVGEKEWKRIGMALLKVKQVISEETIIFANGSWLYLFVSGGVVVSSQIDHRIHIKPFIKYLYPCTHHGPLTNNFCIPSSLPLLSRPHSFFLYFYFFIKIWLSCNFIV